MEVKKRIKNNPSKLKQYRQKYERDNYIKRSLQHKQWEKLNKDKRKEYKAKWYTKNAIRIKNRYNIDMQYTLKKRLGCRIRAAIKSQYTIKAHKTIELLGCSYPFFESYFESKFIEGMSWEKFLNGEIHIDHIKPCYYFDLSDTEQQKICFNYKNLQPLWAYDNLSKNKKLTSSLNYAIMTSSQK